MVKVEGATFGGAAATNGDVLEEAGGRLGVIDVGGVGEDVDGLASTSGAGGDDDDLWGRVTAASVRGFLGRRMRLVVGQGGGRGRVASGVVWGRRL